MPTLEGVTQEATGTVTPQEVTVAFTGPAPFANKTVVTFTPVTGRIAFLELPPSGQPMFRAAVTMTIADLVALQALLNRVLKDVKDLPAEAAPDASKG